jgi:branched-subunit amino acid transport protein
MVALQDGFGGYVVLLALAIFAHEPWRWLGLVLGRRIDAASELFLWVRAVATALVAGLVVKLIVFPAGALAAVPTWMRALALAVAITAFLLTRRSLALGVASGAFVLVGLLTSAGGPN